MKKKLRSKNYELLTTHHDMSDSDYGKENVVF